MITRRRLGIYLAIVVAALFAGLVVVAKLIKIFVWVQAPLSLVPMFVAALLVCSMGSVQLILTWAWEIRLRWSGDAAMTGWLTNMVLPAAKPDPGFSYWRALRAAVARDVRSVKSGSRMHVEGPMLAGMGLVVVAGFLAPRTAHPWWLIGAMLSFCSVFGLAGMIRPQAFVSRSTQRNSTAIARYASLTIVLTPLALGCALTQLPLRLQEFVRTGIPVGLLAVLMVVWLARTRNDPVASAP